MGLQVRQVFTGAWARPKTREAFQSTVTKKLNRKAWLPTVSMVLMEGYASLGGVLRDPRCGITVSGCELKFARMEES